MLTKNLTSRLKKGPFPIRVTGADAHVRARLAGELWQANKSVVVAVAADHMDMEQLAAELAWYFPEEHVVTFPPWDVQPYDRVAPDSEIQARRLKTLGLLKAGLPCVIVTTVNALSVKTPPLEALPPYLELAAGGRLRREDAVAALEASGYLRVGTVMEPGEYAVRGSLLDVYVATDDAPARVDFFDDEIESVRAFEPASQRSGDALSSLHIQPVTDVVLDEARIANFRSGWRAAFPEAMAAAIYRDISEGRRHELMAHYLPLFHDTPLPSLFDALPDDALIVAPATANKAFEARWEAVEEAYRSRQSLEGEVGAAVLSGELAEPYRPLAPDGLYLTPEDWRAAREAGSWLWLEEFDDGSTDMVRLNARPVTVAGEASASAAAGGRAAALDKVVRQIKESLRAGEKVLLAAYAPSSLITMERTLEAHGLEGLRTAKRWRDVKAGAVNAAVAPLAWGFHDRDSGVLVITEQDLFGEKDTRAIRPRRKRSNEEVLSHFSELEVGGLVVHTDHGIGRFLGLVTLDAGGAQQDFIQLEYDGGDKLYVPVVSLDVLSRYSGDDSAGAKLDKLGGAAWQARKAKVKKDLLEMAGDLIRIAAARKTRPGHRYSQPDGMYSEFCAGFPFVPTTEQQQAVEEVEGEMYSAQAMDRLVVGDVGFGKTEVALRAAFVAAADGRQVAVVVPTTLLARQHFAVFTKRFAGFPFRVAQLSRLVTGKDKTEVLAGLSKGTVDIVIGTHALLSKNVKFANLGLLVVDEEQHFGVSHKEQLKRLKETVDVLTLTATPIPRTLQMSLSGLRSLSLITTPPVDRLAVRTYVMGFDPKVIREAIQREIYRGGQVFVVTPRVQGLEKLADALRNLVPEAKIRTAHGQMARDALDRTMSDFYDGRFHVLVATSIVESGLDVPRANTLIVHRADRFGLAQLYQLRGRVGRSKVRAYSYFLLPEGHMTDDAVKRLKILQRLEGVGVGFQLASYDMDIRGAGNILGTEQSGHIREVGFELYNRMLAEAIASADGNDQEEDGTGNELAFTPALSLGLTFMIPEEYVPDLITRMSLYRRLAYLREEGDIADFRAELEDRFGPVPAEVAALLEVVRIKNRCIALNIDKLEVGDKGATLSFFNDTFGKPDALLRHIMNHRGVMTIRPDQKIVIQRPWPAGLRRLDAVQSLLSELEHLEG